MQHRNEEQPPSTSSTRIEETRKCCKSVTDPPNSNSSKPANTELNINETNHVNNNNVKQNYDDNNEITISNTHLLPTKNNKNNDISELTFDQNSKKFSTVNNFKQSHENGSISTIKLPPLVMSQKNTIVTKPRPLPKLNRSPQTQHVKNIDRNNHNIQNTTIELNDFTKSPRYTKQQDVTANNSILSRQDSGEILNPLKIINNANFNNNTADRAAGRSSVTPPLENYTYFPTSTGYFHDVDNNHEEAKNKQSGYTSKKNRVKI